MKEDAKPLGENIQSKIINKVKNFGTSIFRNQENIQSKDNKRSENFGTSIFTRTYKVNIINKSENFGYMKHR
jgi:hypothetical protein